MNRIVRTGALALTGLMMMAAAPASAATYLFSDSYDTEYGKGRINGTLVTSDAESGIDGYHQIEKLTVDEVSFSGFSLEYNFSLGQFVLRPFSIERGSLQFKVPSTNEAAMFNPDSLDVLLKGSSGKEKFVSFEDFGGNYFEVTNFLAGGDGMTIRLGPVYTNFGTPNLTLSPLVAAVPEPASWAMMIGGFGLVGGTLRGRRKVAVRFA